MIELARYYGVGVINTAFGYGMFAFFIYLGFNIYLAQITSHVLGVAFNYFSYTRHVFREHQPSRWLYILSYAVNYLIGLSSLLVVRQFVSSPYLAGLCSLIITSVINYFMLKFGVFRIKKVSDASKGA